MVALETFSRIRWRVWRYFNWGLAALKGVVRLLALLLLLPALAGCSSSGEDSSSGTKFNTKVIIDGSDTMAVLMSALSRQFSEEHKGVAVQIISTDSGSGIAKLFDKGADIAAASRDLTDDETKQAETRGLKLKKAMIARDAIAVIVNPQNQLGFLTIPDLRSIYLGEKTNWKDFGGSIRAIKVFAREAESGTSRYFKEHVLEKRDYPAADEVLRSQDEVIKRVAANPYAIGYVGMVESKEAGSKIKVVPLKLMTSSSQAVTPSQETLVSDYPLGRPLYLIYDAGPNSPTKKFVDFCASPVAQKIIKEAGFVSVH
jgi:phosphate transport system substrate-binding protein